MSAIHPIALTVRVVRRSQTFCAELLNFQHVTNFGPRAMLHNGSFLLALRLPPDASQAPASDRFNENRIGLDHLSLSVTSMADLHTAMAVLDAHSFDHGTINPLEPFGIAVLAFRDPDNIQLELTAPLA